MTTLANRPNTALIVVDVQHDVVAEAYERDAVIGRIAELVTRARQARVPVIWVQDHESLPEGSDGWQIVPELQPDTEEPRISKEYGDSFEATDLEEVLARLAAGRLFIAGAQTDFCIRATLHGALVRGYDTTLISDAHTTEDLSEWGAPPPAAVIAHTNLYWSQARAPGRATGTMATADVDFGAAPSETGKGA